MTLFAWSLTVHLGQQACREWVCMTSGGFSRCDCHSLSCLQPVSFADLILQPVQVVCNTSSLDHLVVSLTLCSAEMRHQAPQPSPLTVVT